MTHTTIIRNREHGPGVDELVIHAVPTELPPLAADPSHHIGHTARMPGRGYRADPPNPWTVRLLGYALVLVALATTAVLLWQ